MKANEEHQLNTEETAAENTAEKEGMAEEKDLKETVTEESAAVTETEGIDAEKAAAGAAEAKNAAEETEAKDAAEGSEAVAAGRAEAAAAVERAEAAAAVESTAAAAAATAAVAAAATATAAETAAAAPGDNTPPADPAPSKPNKGPVIAGVAIILAAAIGFGAWLGITQGQKKVDEEKKVLESAEQAVTEEEASDGLARSEDTLQNTIYYNGAEYHKKEGLSTILFMGVDDTEDTEHTEILADGGRSDTLILFILNENDKSSEMISISRDTITEVDVYNEDGEYVYSGDMQITLQYSFGESRLKSCYLTKKTVSELLYGTQIDGYISLTMDGISKIVDLMGGLTVTMPKDYSYIDKAYTEGAEVKIDGAAAEHFVRYRDIEEFGSNNERMERQAWFMRQVFSALKKAPDMGDLLDRLLDKADKYVETDLSGEQIKALASYTLADEPIYLPGSDKEGVHDEFYVDDDALQQLLIELFYEPA